MGLIARSCALFLWMHTLTLVKSQDCTLQQFLSSTLYNSNFDTTALEASYPDGKQVRVGCNIGHTGFFKLICEKGKWGSRGNPCEPRSCGHPGDAQFADFHLEIGNDFVFGSQVVFTCQTGYQMVSRRNYRRCMAEGWDGVVPVCEALQCPLIQVGTNVHVIGNPDESTYGNVVRFTCKSSTEILDGSAEMYCDENGEWSSRVPNCIEIQCPPPNIEHGFVQGNVQKYKENDVLHFRCNARYKRVDTRPSMCLKQGVTAEWSPTPACEPIKCSLPSPLEGTSYEPSSRNMFSPGDTVEVMCGRKYGITNNQDTTAVTTCKENGDWTLRPVCQEVTCSYQRPQNVYYWNIRWRHQVLKLDETVSYSCQTGYMKTDGATDATCTRNGWEPNPLCQEIQCPPPNIEHGFVQGNIQKYKENDVLNFVCNARYKRVDTRPSMCIKQGVTAEWSPTPACELIKCRLPSPLEGTSYEPSSRNMFSPGDTVEVTCGRKYWITNNQNTTAVATCKGNGDWTFQPVCQEVTCSYQKPQNVNYWSASRRHQVITLDDTVSYSCQTGYMKTDGATDATCTRNGWEPNPLCQEITCNRQDYQNSYIDGNDQNIFKYNERVNYICNAGYEGRFALTCGETGWIRTKQCSKVCKKLLIDNTQMTHNEKETYRLYEQAQYTCRNEAKTVFTVTCKQSGWTGIKSCSECPTADVPNGFIVGPYNETVYYTCNEGYKLSTDGWWAEAKCTDGVWSGLKQCIANTTCGEVPKIPHGSVTPPRDPTKNARIICEDGYRVEVNRLTCHEGEWILPKTICTPTAVTCKSPPKVDNAVIVDSYQKEYLSDSTVTYRCRDKYILLEHEDTIRCRDGQWEEKNIMCTPDGDDSDPKK